MTLNKQLREVIKLNDPEFSLKMQRFCLQFTKDTYARAIDMQSLLLLNKVEEQFKLVQQPDKYLKDIEHALGIQGATLLKKEPADIVEQFAKRQRANLIKFSGFESPAEQQFMILQKDMINGLLKEYKNMQRKALKMKSSTAEKNVELG